ncbi:MAG: alanine racemase [Bacteroidales bacterium]
MECFRNQTSYINKQALTHNLNFIQDLVGKKVRFSSVIKGNAYGYGIEVFVPLAEDCGINHFSVFDANEALRAYNALRQNSGIMIMGMIDMYELDWAIQFMRCDQFCVRA